LYIGRIDTIYKIVLASQDAYYLKELQRRLFGSGYTFFMVKDIEELPEKIFHQQVELALIDIGSASYMDNDHYLWAQLKDLKKQHNFAVIVLIPEILVRKVDSVTEITDFVTIPVDFNELEMRIKRVLKPNIHLTSSNTIKSGDLIIDTAQCEVSVAGRPVELTFKEYELLKFLVSSKGRVFTRKQLLDQLWGYDYYGGDRTVDVHIRRLRVKIEDLEHTFIDTVRNIGYRFHNTK
jgi:two-component system alkaline phosphatase synthesis response regulator PhoP